MTPRSWLLLIALASPARPVEAASAAGLAPGDPLPLLEAKTLSGDSAALPRDVQGHGALLVFGFSKAAAKMTRPWMDGCRAAEPRVHCYDIRMVEDVPRLFRGSMERGMKGGFPVELQRQTLLVYDENDAWRERLGATDGKSAYILACDAEGRVRAITTGQFMEAQLQKLLEAIDE